MPLHGGSSHDLPSFFSHHEKRSQWIACGCLLVSTSSGLPINQPGVYGRIDIGNFPPPAVIHAQPVIIAPAPVVVQQRPVYLYVPPGHQKNWSKHCGRYGACGQPVYFVQESWVRARYEEQHAHSGGGHGKGKKHKGKHGDD
jgi:hypothetical protein